MEASELGTVRQWRISGTKGDRLPDALGEALARLGAEAGFLHATGTLTDVEVTIPTVHGEQRREFRGPCELLGLSGPFAGEIVDLNVTLAVESERGLEIVGGRLVTAEVALLSGYAIGSAIGGAKAVVPAPTATTATAPQPAPVSIGSPAPMPVVPSLKPTSPSGESLPAGPPGRKKSTYEDDDDLDSYPEPGDTVTHFHFGECTVVDSDGERIRLRMGEEGRVREVALSMLRIQAPTVDENGKKHWRLNRKN